MKKKMGRKLLSPNPNALCLELLVVALLAGCTGAEPKPRGQEATQPKNHAIESCRLDLSWEPCEQTGNSIVIDEDGSGKVEIIGFSKGDEFAIVLCDTTGRDFRGRSRNTAGVLALISPERNEVATLAEGVSYRGVALSSSGRYLWYFRGEEFDDLSGRDLGPVRIIDLERMLCQDLGDNVNWREMRLSEDETVLRFCQGPCLKEGTVQSVFDLSAWELRRLSILRHGPGGQGFGTDIEIEYFPGMKPTPSPLAKCIPEGGKPPAGGVMHSKAFDRVIFVCGNRLESITTDGSKRDLLFQCPGRIDEFRDIKLTPDQKWVIMQPEKNEIWAISPDGKEKNLLCERIIFLDFQVTKDSRWVVFTESGAGGAGKLIAAPVNGESRIVLGETAERPLGGQYGDDLCLFLLFKGTVNFLRPEESCGSLVAFRPLRPGDSEIIAKDITGFEASQDGAMVLLDHHPEVWSHTVVYHLTAQRVEDGRQLEIPGLMAIWRLSRTGRYAMIRQVDGRSSLLKLSFD